MYVVAFIMAENKTVAKMQTNVNVIFPTKILRKSLTNGEKNKH